MSKIAFIHFDKFKSEDFYVHNQGFNFDANYHFFICKDKLIVNDKCKVDLYSDKKTNISISAIVGKNGSGKSSVINSMKNIFCGSKLIDAFNDMEISKKKKESHQRLDIGDSMSVVIKINKNSYIYFAPKELKINTHNILFEYKGKAFNYGNRWCRNSGDEVNANAPFENTTFINYNVANNFKNYTQEIIRDEKNENNIIDISTSYLMQKDVSSFYQQWYQTYDNNHTTLYNSIEKRRQLMFVMDDKNDKLLKNLFKQKPNKNQAKLFIIPTDPFDRKLQINQNGFLLEYYCDIITKINLNIDNLTKATAVVFNEFIYYLLNYLLISVIYILKSFSSDKEKELLFKKLSGEQLDNYKNSDYYKNHGRYSENHFTLNPVLIDFDIKQPNSDAEEYQNFTYILQYAETTIKNILNKVDEKSKISNNLKKLLIIKEKLLLLKKDAEWAYNNNSGISIDFSNSFNINAVMDLIELERTIGCIPPFLRFELNSFSSGESALLSLFSRFESISDDELKKDIVVFLDEPELYLHPEWQRKFINTFLTFLKSSNKYMGKNIQIILTSNTPYLLTDIPIGNIIFLENTNGETVIINREKETFASNIHQLLKEDFFMESFIGEFATNFIKDIISSIKNGDFDDSIDSKIEIVGEPIIKQKLNQMFAEKRQSLRIKELEQKIEALEKND